MLLGYSMGAWIAYEVLCLAKQKGLPLPLHFIPAAMVSPDLPKAQRPWKCTATLDTAGFQVSIDLTQNFTADEAVMFFGKYIKHVTHPVPPNAEPVKGMEQQRGAVSKRYVGLVRAAPSS